MGSSNSTGADEMQFNSKDWVEDEQQSIQDIKNYTNMKNIHTGQVIHRYQVGLLSENDYHTYVESLKWRKNQPFIVRVYHYQTQKQKEFCSTSYSVTVYLSTIKGRLSQFKDIPFPDNLYCMMAMLEGYNKLHDKIGRFYVCQEQVCIDDKGEIRVWLNNDLKKNFPQFQQYEQGNFLDDESGMVDQILQMVINNTDESQEPQMKFSEYYEREKFHRNNQIGFEEGKAIINDYARQNNMQIPDVFQSVLEMYQIQGFNHENQNEDLEFLANQLNHDLPPINLNQNNAQGNLVPVGHQQIQNKDTNHLQVPVQSHPIQYASSNPNPNMNPNMNPNLNLNMPINNRPVINHQAISPLRQVNQTSNINHIVHPNFPHTQLPSPQPQPHRPQIHYQPQPMQYIQKPNNLPVQHPSPFKVQQRVQVKPVNTFSNLNINTNSNVNLNSFNQIHQQTPHSNQVPTPHFYPTPQKQMNPFEMIQGNKVSKIIQDRQQNSQQNYRQNNYVLQHNSRQRERQYEYENNSEEEIDYEKQQHAYEEHHHRYESEEEGEQPILQDLNKFNRMQNIEEEDNLFDQVIEQRKVTQSQAQRIQQSQHSQQGHVKYSAPSSQIYQYQSGNMIITNNNNSNMSNLSGLSNLPKKGKQQYYYTVQEQQQLDPQIAADLLLYT